MDVKKIVIPIDFSETSLLAIDHGAFMAKLYKAGLVLVHVVERNWQDFSIVVPELKFEAPSNMFTLIENKLQDLAEKIRKEYGVNVTAISTEGSICKEVVDLVKTENADLIIMGTHGISGFEEVFLGSNSFKVVTLAECPVLTVQSHSRRIGFSELLLPIDNSRHSSQKVSHAVSLAKKYGARINVLGLLEADDATEIDKFNVKIERVIEYIEKSEIPVTMNTIVGGNLAKNTIGAAKQNNSDLIIIMTDQDENFTGSFLGPYAQQIVNLSWVPVLSIKPMENEENLSWAYPYT